jgi:hypothetical protein
MSFHPVVPESVALPSRKLADWWRERAQWVFKPPIGMASRGVQMGYNMRQAQLRRFASNTLAQRAQPTRIYRGDGTQYDLRFYTCGSHVLAVTTRHFVGDKMGLGSPSAGLKLVVVVQKGKGEAGDAKQLSDQEVAAITAVATVDSVGPCDDEYNLYEAVGGHDVFETAEELAGKEAQRRAKTAKDQLATKKSFEHKVDLQLRRASGARMKAVVRGVRDKATRASISRRMVKAKKDVYARVKAGKIDFGQTAAGDADARIEVVLRAFNQECDAICKDLPPLGPGER